VKLLPVGFRLPIWYGPNLIFSDWQLKIEETFMNSCLKSSEDLLKAKQEIYTHLNSHPEWLCKEGRDSHLVSLCPDEWELQVAYGQLLFSYCGNRGIRIWRVLNWRCSESKMFIEVSKRMGADITTLELIPRASEAKTKETILEARQIVCFHLAELIHSTIPGSTIERIGLSQNPGGAPGRYARMLLRLTNGSRIAATGIVIQNEKHKPESFVSSSIIWFERLLNNRNPPRKLCLLVPNFMVAYVSKLIGLLHPDLKNRIDVYSVDNNQQLSFLPNPELDQLFDKPKNFKFSFPKDSNLSLTRRIVDVAPEEIDVIRGRHGETLRFNGLSFARVRKIVNVERGWFGLNKIRQPINESTWPDLVNLIKDLKIHRTAEPPDKRHLFYTSSSEAWLDSLLRRDLNCLDKGLIPSPFYAQFRTYYNESNARPIDLFALRHDGRLVLIELKAIEDRDVILQAVDYWRSVESLRKSGAFRKTQLFGDKKIADLPPLVYIVAPILRFHKDFRTIVRTINPAIEIYCFGINENWRGHAGIQVVKRENFPAASNP
jgi:hypothetical protein